MSTVWYTELKPEIHTFQDGSVDLSLWRMQVLHRVGKKDPITRMFEIIVLLFGFEVDVQFWAQYTSFVLVGTVLFSISV